MPFTARGSGNYASPCRMVWLPDGKKFDDTFSHFKRIPACDGQTDGRMNRQTPFDSIVCAMHRLHGEIP